MAVTLLDRLRHSWNAFTDAEKNRNKPVTMTYESYYSYGSSRPDRLRPLRSIERTVVQSIYNRMAVDAASISLRHVRTDGDGRYLEDIKSGLQECLSVEANIDQGGQMFRQDIYQTLLQEGYLGIAPIDTTSNPREMGSYGIKTMRVGRVVEWKPEHVVLSLYNDRTGQRENVLLPKRIVAIVENPFYSVMNEPSSTLQRLQHKLNLLDQVDEQSSSGKLDILIQLPYVVKSDLRRQQAETRRKELEVQLKDSKYGIGYIDGTERITQLNRPVENNLLKQVEYLTALLYSQLGITEEIMKGTADSTTMLNYYNRTIGPIVDAVVESMTRTFITKTARTQGHAVRPFRDPFKLVPVDQIAEMGDKLTRNEIASSNEIRMAIGWKPSKDPKADELRNANMPQPGDGEGSKKPEKPLTDEERPWSQKDSTTDL